MGVQDIYRDKASLGHLPVLRGQTLIETPYRLQADANTTALWWFDETQGIQLLDKKGTNFISLVDTPAWGAGGVCGSDLGFDGVADYGAAASIIDFTSAFTIEALVKTTSAAAYPQVIHASNTTQAPNYGNTWCLRFSSGYATVFFTNGTNNYEANSSAVLNDGAYHYLVGRLGSDVLDIFSNGVNVGTANVSGNVAACTRPPTIARATTEAGNPSNYLAASIAMIRLSAMARSDAEILTNAKLMGFA